MAMLITPKGEIVTVQPASEKEGFTLEELYKLIDTDMVEVISVRVSAEASLIMIIDEEGKLKGKPINILATQYANLFPGDCIVGNAVVCKEAQFK